MIFSQAVNPCGSCKQYVTVVFLADLEGSSLVEDLTEDKSSFKVDVLLNAVLSNEIKLVTSGLTVVVFEKEKSQVIE